MPILHRAHLGPLLRLSIRLVPWC